MARSGNGGTVTVEQAQEMVRQAEAQRAEAVAGLQARLDELDSEREEIAAQIKSLGGKSSRRGRRGPRARNDTSLDVTVAGILLASKEPLSPTGVIAAVKKSGYTSNSPNFDQMVAQSLTRLGKITQGTNKSPIVNHPSRGMWQAGSGLKAWIAAQSDSAE